MRDKALSERLDRVSMALLMLINMLRDTQEIDGRKYMAAIPESLLDRLEAMITLGGKNG